MYTISWYFVGLEIEIFILFYLFYYYFCAHFYNDCDSKSKLRNDSADFMV